jgi:hypothetical protein
MKRFLCVCTIFIMMAFVFAGCGNKEADNSNEQTSNNPVESSVNETSKNSGADIKVNMGASGTNMSLPDGFPRDVVPLLDDANIVNVIDNKESMAMGVTYTTDKSLEEAIAFYQNVFKDVEERVETKTDSGYMLFGKKNNIDITAVIAKYDGDKISILLNVSMVDQQKSMSINSSESNYFTDAEVVDLPEDYPKDKLPVINADKVTEASLTESDSGKSFYLIVASQKSIKDIAAHYETAWGNLKNKYKNVSSEEFDLQGEIEKYSINIRGTVQDDKTQTVEYHILIDEIN